MELHELGVEHLGAGEGGEAQPVAAHLRRVGGDGVEAAQAAGGQHRGRGDHGQEAAVALHQRPTHPAGSVLQQGAGAGAGPHLHVRRGAHGGGDGLGDGAPGPVAAHAGDPGAAVRGLQALDEAAVRVPVERRAQGGECADRVGPGGHQGAHRLRVGQAGARGQRVRPVQLGAVVRPQRRGHPALRPGGGAALRQRRRRDQHHPPRRRGQGGAQAGEAGAEHQHAVELQPVGHQISSTSTWWRARARS